MSPVVAKEIRDWMESEHASARDPFTGVSVGADDFIIMGSSDFEPKEDAPTQVEVESVRRGMADFEEGGYIEARELSQKICDRFGVGEYCT